MQRLRKILNIASITQLACTVLTGCLFLLFPAVAGAVGTAAGTTISNTAGVTYTLASDPTPLTASATDTFQVQEVIDVALVWQDAAPVAVNSPHTDRLLTVLMTNTGNGREAFDLTTDDTLGNDQFDPDVQSLWIESNGTPGLQSDDTQYNGTGLGLNADQAAVVYVLSNIPPGYIDGDQGDVQVSALARTAGASGQPPGTSLPGAGTGGVDAVVGVSQGQARATAAYRVATVSVSLSKSIQRVVDPAGGNQPSTGARITYRIQVDVAGSGTAEGLVVSDPIPGDMTYVGGSLRLDGITLTDAADGDGGDYGATAPDTVTVAFNDTVAPATWTIEFETIID